MAINEEIRRKKFKECKSFDELSKVCRTYGMAFEKFADEIRNKLYELPPEFNEPFIRYLLLAYHCDNDLIADNIHSTYAQFLRDYANKIVNAGLLQNYSIESDYIPVIVFSATNHDKIHESYLFQATNLIADNFTPDNCVRLFCNHEFGLDPVVHYKSDPTDRRGEMRIRDILTSNVAWEDWLYQFVTQKDIEDDTEYMRLRAKYIYQECIANNSHIDKEAIDEIDIYNFLIYLVTSIEQNVKYLDSVAQRIVFESGIRAIYDSIDMILLYIAIKPKKDATDEDIHWTEKTKVTVMQMLISEAFQFMYQCRNQLNKREDIRSYFKIDYDEKHNAMQYRVIPDSPMLLLNKCDSENFTAGPMMKDMLSKAVVDSLSNNAKTTAVLEAYDRNSSKMDQASRKIYSGYKAYKDAENKVDSQISKLITRIKGVFTGEKTARDRIIEGEQFSAIKILKKIMTTAAIFSYSKIAGVLFVITRHYCSKAVDNKERKRLIGELELEIKMLDEKIDDARGDGNRQAKYSMMRTRAELQKALEQIKYGLTADKNAINTAKAVMSGKKSLDYRGPDRNQDYE